MTDSHGNDDLKAKMREALDRKNSKEYEIERLYREAAFMLIGEGTSDIQKMIIGRSLLKDYKS